jgi:hypothetical protein
VRYGASRQPLTIHQGRVGHGHVVQADLAQRAAQLVVALADPAVLGGRIAW